MKSGSIVELREKTKSILVWATWGVALVSAALGYFQANSALTPGVIALAFGIIATLALRAQPDVGRKLISLALIGQCTAFTAAFQGAAWQMDSHMLFFATLAGIAMMLDVSAIAVGIAAVLVHHLVLGVTVPALVFPSTDIASNIERAVFHAVILGFEAVFLIGGVFWLIRLDRQNLENVALANAAKSDAENARIHAEDLQQQAEDNAQQASEAHSQAEQSLEHLKHERELREQAMEKAADIARQDEEQRAAQNAQVQDVLKELRQALAALAKGDLCYQLNNELPEQYEVLREDFNQSVDTLRMAITGISDKNRALLSQVGSIAENANTVASGSDEQVNSLEATSIFVNSLSESVTDSAENARRTAQHAQTVHEGAQQGRAVVQNVVAAMGEIETSSKEIANISELIDELAIQTNLLALNASVEAARAGDAGLGFAVVASEVRSLALRAKSAAEDITTLIEKSGEQVKLGSNLVGEAGDQLDEILHSVGDISGSVESIAESNEKQSGLLHELTVTFGDLDRLAKANAGLFQSTGGSCDALREKVEQIDGDISGFQIANSGSSHGWDEHRRDVEQRDSVDTFEAFQSARVVA